MPIAVLTGAAGGLGRAMLAGLIAEGWMVLAVDRPSASLAELRGDCVTPHEADFTDPDAVDGIVAAASSIGPVDALINNAGLGLDRIRRDFMQRPIRFWEVDPALTADFFAVNGLAPFRLAQALARGMMARGFGRIVNVTTSLDSMLRPGFAPYGGTKASLEAHTAVMAGDLDGSGVTANVLVPGGPADTGMIPAESGFARDRLIAPAVMVPPLLWLLATASAGVNGQRILAVRWRKEGAAAHNLDSAAAPAAWPQLGAQTLWPQSKPITEDVSP